MVYQSERWKSFSLKLKENSKKSKWEFKNILNDKSPNKWHPLVIYKPVIDILNSYNDSTSPSITTLASIFENEALKLIELVTLKTEKEYKELREYIDNLNIN